MGSDSDSAKYTPPPPDLPNGPPPAPPESEPGTAGNGRDSDPSGDRPEALQVRVAPEGDDEGRDAEDVVGGEASLPNRVAATAIDFVVATGLYLGVMLLLPDYLERVSSLIWVGYVLTRDSLPFLQGQSVGKKAMGIQAVTSEGKSLMGNWQPGLVRNAVLLIPLFPLVELFVLISRQDRPDPALRLGDEWAKTKVVNAPRPEANEKACQDGRP